MEKKLFSPMEIDALGEMMNISLGSSATAVSNLLEHRVDITTPKVTAIQTADFALGNLEPAMGIEIRYVEGLAGSNIMLLKRSDIKVIVDILMGGETPDEEFELNELTISAVCEVMNQMMGAAATAMSDFLGYQVDISTPQPFELEDLTAFKENHLPQGAETIVIVRFSLKIEGALESEFMNVMSVELAKELLKGLGLEDIDGGEEAPPAPAPAPAPAAEPASSGGKMSQEEIEAMMAGMAGGGAPAPAPAPEPASSGGKMSQEEIEAMMAGMAGGGAPAPAPAPEPATAAANAGDEAENAGDPAEQNEYEGMTVEEICARMTPEEARNILVPLGTCKGWTLDMVLDRRPTSLKWYIVGCAGASNVLKAGATLLWNSYQMAKAG